MTKGRIMVVEDDFDISNMLRIYFTGQGFDVQVAPRGSEALTLTRKQLPQLIVLDIMLPDIDGYEVCRRLRTTMRTRHIPIIFLTQKDERSDKIAGLELGADDYITKPFDIEELKLRVQNAIARADREKLTDPRSGLPSGRMIEDQLRELMKKEKWALLDMRISQFEPFRDVYGFVASDELLRFTSMLVGDVVDDLGTPDDFIGHAGNDNFIIITPPDKAESIRDKLEERFNEEVLTHYSFVDREQKGIKMEDGKGGEKLVPLMTLAVGNVTAERGFSDIREITEAAAEERRKRQMKRSETA
jgi:PleD family two-component response regulator